MQKEKYFYLLAYQKVMSLNEFNAVHRSFQRNYLSATLKVEIDAQSRFLVPKKMLVHAQVTKEAVMIGVGNRLEVWNPKIYDKFLIKDQMEFAKLAQEYLGNDT